ncbi:MAG TPA: shikimate dehydrogenase, partial [Sandaracinaceae bacterium]
GCHRSGNGDSTMNTTTAPDRYALVGHPVHHSRSPVIHSLFAQQTGQHLTYELIDAAPDEFENAVRRFIAEGGRGMNVTVPHKEAAFRLADRIGPEAEKAGAVNTLSFDEGSIRGDNTDGIGFLRDLTENLGWEIRGRRILVLGAGGAARGILPPLLENAPSELVLANRTLPRAAELEQRFRRLGPLSIRAFEELERERPFDLVINATSAGLKGEMPPFPRSIVGERTRCYDLAYARGLTPFQLWAREAGAERAEQGLGMLVEQAAESFYIWRKVRPDTQPVIQELKDFA